MTRSEAISRMRTTRGQNARAQRAMRQQWNAERLAAKHVADEQIADEIAARSLDRLEALAELEDYLGRVSDERQQKHRAVRHRLCSDVTRIVTDVNRMFREFQGQSESRMESLGNGRKDVASMLDQFHAAREAMRNERLKFGAWFRVHLAGEASRICREDFSSR